MYPPPYPPQYPSGGPAPAVLPPEQRQAILNQQVASMVARQGAYVESQGYFQAVLVTGQPVNHVLHAVLFVVTCGMWAIPWIIIAVTGGVRRDIVQVNEWGYISMQRISGPLTGG